MKYQAFSHVRRCCVVHVLLSWRIDPLGVGRNPLVVRTFESIKAVVFDHHLTVRGLVEREEVTYWEMEHDFDLSYGPSSFVVMVRRLSSFVIFFQGVFLLPILAALLHNNNSVESEKK